MFLLKKLSKVSIRKKHKLQLSFDSYSNRIKQKHLRRFVKYSNSHLIIKKQYDI